MIYRVQMKDPGTLHDAVRDAAKKELKGIQGIDDDEKEELLERRTEKLEEQAQRWFGYGEYLMVEIDTEKNTIRVVPRGELQE
jgi:hypothetical protein